jgi:hypothetical protein
VSDTTGDAIYTIGGNPKEDFIIQAKFYVDLNINFTILLRKS